MRWVLVSLLLVCACVQTGTAWQAGAGTYVAELPASGSPGRRLTLELGVEGNATLWHDYHDGKPALREKARWEPLGKQVKLYLFGWDRIHGKEGDRLEVKQTLVFELEKQGLKAVEWDKAVWGSAGLDLMKQPLTPTLP